LIVKICGLTRVDDALAAAAAGADWLGLNLWPPSKRFVDRAAAAAIAAALRAAAPAVRLVGVFVDQPADQVREAAAALGLDQVQLHGDESPAYGAGLGLPFIKALAGDLARAADYDCELVLVDAVSPGRGGSGRSADWAAARVLADGGRKLLLAGGLTPDNVAAAIAAVGPWGVDVASGVESAPGRKDAERMRRFVAAARAAGR
jgi:phosphoribosylanthranilate isomerase